jgi:hypothetical protein
VISALDLGVERPRDAMMLRAPETEALYEGYAQKGFGFLGIDGSPMPLGSTATNETTGVSKTLWGGEAPQCHRIKTCGSKSSNTNKLISEIINNH